MGILKYFFLFFVGLFLLYIGLFKRDKFLTFKILETKCRIGLLSIIIFSLVLMFAITIKDSYDLSMYSWAYNKRLSHGKEPLFDIIQFACHDLKISFNLFKTIWCSIVVLLLINGIRKYTDSYNAVIALSILMPFVAYVTQMRNAMVAAIMINTFPLLFTNQWLNRVKYIIIVVLCAQIHIIAYVYLIFLVINRKDRRFFSKKYYIIVGVVTMCSLLFETIPTNTILNFLQRVHISETTIKRISGYFDGDKTSIKSVVLILFKHLLMFILTDRACKLLSENRFSIGKENLCTIQSGKFILKDRRCKSYVGKKMFRKKSDNVCMKISEMNILMLLFLPISIINLSFERVFDCFMLIQFAMIFNVRNAQVGVSTFFVAKGMKMQTALLLLILVLWVITLKTNPDDLVRVYNSVSF